MASVGVVWLVAGGWQAHAWKHATTRLAWPDLQRSLTVELMIIVLLLCVLGALAARFGADSRVGLRSDEEQAARYGMTWADPR
jgi:hypothetical protein